MFLQAKSVLVGLYHCQDTSEVTALQDKLNQANNKVAEFRNQCEKLKKDLKVAHKVRSS